MKIAIISLYDLENCAVRFLASFLRRSGHDALEVYFKDWKNNTMLWPTEQELQLLCDRLRTFNPGAIGISLRASAYMDVCRLLALRLKAELGVPIILGGIHPTLCPETVTEFSDYVVRGDGEDTLLELINKLERGEDANEVEGSWAVTEQGAVRENPLRCLLADLTRSSWRDWDHPHKLVIDGANVTHHDPLLVDPIYLTFASRGCPYGCAFCYNSTLRKLMKGKGRYWRLRPVEDIMAELADARRSYPKMRRVRFDDEIFPIDPKWLDQFISHYPREVGLPFECFLEPRAYEPERLDRLVKAGLDVVYLGVQANDRVARRLYDRPSEPDLITRAAWHLNKLGVETRYLVMVDDPLSTEEDRRAVFELLNALPRPFRVYLFSMTVMPGTELERKLLDDGVIEPHQVEGRGATKTFEQYRVSLDWDRPPDESFWVSMLVLVNKPWLPPKVLAAMADSSWLRQNHRLLAHFASLSNNVQMAGMVPSALLRGEIGWRVIRRFWNPGAWVTS